MLKTQLKLGSLGWDKRAFFTFAKLFFYIPRSKSLLVNLQPWQFLNPWAGPTDPKRPAWKQLTVADKEIVENYLKTYALLGEQYFILWIPLRIKEADNRCIVPNYYNDRSIRAHLPENMDAKLAALLPMLRSLREIHYWLPDEAGGQLQEEFCVRLDVLAERCSYPRSSEKFHTKMERSLFGRISLSQTNFAIYGGREAILEAEKFYSLLPLTSQVTLDFWNALKESEYWPKRSTEDDEGNALSVPDKAVPHCAVVFSQQAAQGTGSLTLQWSVFLPLVDGESDFVEFEQIKCAANWDYTLLLHGYFFLDSGRRYIEALKDICEGKVFQQTPENENQMVQLWNAILATTGTLSNILPALDEFNRQHQLDEQDIAALCASLQRTKIFNSQFCQEYLYSDFYWVYQLHPEHSTWQLVKKTQRILALPSIPEDMWEAFPELRRCVENNCLVLVSRHNLLPSGKPDSWKESEIQAILRSIDVKNVFAKPKYVQFLVDLLQGLSKPIAVETQNCLKSVLKQAFLQLEPKHLAHIKDLISLIQESDWFEITCNDIQLLHDIYREKLNILIVPQGLAPQRKIKTTISGYDAGVLIFCLVKNRERIFEQSKQLIQQIVEATPDREIEAFCKGTDNLEFISGFDCRDNRNRFYTLAEISALQQQGLLFLESRNRNFATDLQAVLGSKTIVLVDRAIANKLLGEDLRDCDRSACLSVLQQKPELSSIENRTKLLKRLL